MNFFDDDKWKKRLSFIGSIVLVILFFKFIYPVIWPLLIAFLFVAPSYNILLNVQQKTRWNIGVITGLSIFLFFLLIGIVCVWLLQASFQIGIENAKYFSDINDRCEILQNDICRILCQICGCKREMVQYHVTNIYDNISRYISYNCIPSILNKSMISIKIIMKTFGKIVVAILTIILLSKEYGEYRKKVLQNKSLIPVMRLIKRLGRMIKQYLKAQGKIMIIIFGILLVGLHIAKCNHPIYYSLIGALLDVLPFIGTGITLIPIGICMILQGKYLYTIVVGITYITCAITREFLEPHFIGAAMNISSVGIFVSVFAGVKIYGLSGLILGPITFMISTQLYCFYFNKTPEK